VGRFESADGGTLFLDELGTLPLVAQAKLLRVLQEGEFERVGGNRGLRTDARVIAATNRDLQAQVAAGRFRSDLFYRLNVFPITVPPLRQRREDIPKLVQHFALKASRRLGKPLDGIAPVFIEQAKGRDWPGNVRELENAVERALIMSTGGALQRVESSTPATNTAPTAGPLEEMERNHITRILESANWVIEGEKGAARILDINASTLRGRMRKLGIRRI
jgi:transcriptional regulator with GAF, ATPase, and Fis domain